MKGKCGRIKVVAREYGLEEPQVHSKRNEAGQKEAFLDTERAGTIKGEPFSIELKMLQDSLMFANKTFVSCKASIFN